MRASTQPVLAPPAGMKEGITVVKKNQNMLQGPLFWNIVRYTVPIILTSLLQLLFNAADLVVVGRYCGSLSVAAVGATGSITNLLVNFFVGFSVGAGVTVAHAQGGREDAAVHKTVHTALPLALVSGVFLTAVGVSCAGTFLRWMGTPDTVLSLAATYMRIYFAGTIFNLIYNFSASILRAVGDTKSPLIFLTVAGVVNVVLNVIFVTALHMDVAGVALATIISQAISAVAVVLVLMRRRDAARLELKKLRFHRVQLTKIVRLGLPAGLQSSLFSISNVLIQSSVNSFGDVFMSGNAAAGNLEGFVYVTMNAFQQTAVNFVGQNMGAQQYKRVKKILWICLGCVAVVGMAAGGAVYGFGKSLLSIYIPGAEQAIEYGLIRLSLICLPYFLCGIMDVTTGALRGMGASFVPMLICVLGVCGFRIGWIYTVFQMPQYHTPQCLYLSYPISWILTFAAEMVAFLLVYRHHIRRAQLHT